MSFDINEKDGYNLYWYLNDNDCSGEPVNETQWSVSTSDCEHDEDQFYEKSIFTHIQTGNSGNNNQFSTTDTGGNTDSALGSYVLKFNAIVINIISILFVACGTDYLL